MNKIKKILTFTLIAGFAFNTLNTSAQAIGAASATVTTTAKVITPLTIVKNTDMNFGTMAVNGSAGTLALSPTNGLLASGGVDIIVDQSVAASALTVSGQKENAYTITIRETLMLRLASDISASGFSIIGDKVMPLSAFVLTNNGAAIVSSSFTAASGVSPTTTASAVFPSQSLDDDGDSALLIGATISLTLGQKVGTYTGAIVVDVAYD